jgi:hypothetical protein
VSETAQARAGLLLLELQAPLGANHAVATAICFLPWTMAVVQGLV